MFTFGRDFLYRRTPNGFRLGGFGGSSREEHRPMHLRLRRDLDGPWRLCFFDRQPGHGIDDRVKAGLAYRVEIGIRHGVHEVDGVGDAVLNGELDRVEVVAESAAEGEGVLLDPLEELRVAGGRFKEVTVLVRLAGIVGHDADFGLAYDEAAKVLLKVNGRLKGHAEVAGLVVGGEELVAIVDVEDVAPATAVVRLEEGGKADVVEDAVPVERVFEITNGAGADQRREDLVRA